MKIHFVGISGVSMHALALIARSRGHTVTGSDRDLNGHDAKRVEGCDLVVYTSAVPQDNCELVRARELNIPTVERALYLGELSRAYGKVIAVAGCHGKSTASAMLGAAFAPLRPTVHVGVAGSSCIGSDKYFITEACEYKAHFLHLTPDIGIVLNVGFDHPDYYADMTAMTDAYRAFCANCKCVIINGDDKIARDLCDAVTFGLGENNDYRAVDITNDNGYRSFTLAGKRRGRVKLSVPGEHNVYNALSCIAAADICGLDISRTVTSLSKFGGIKRRFERKGIAFGKTVFTDYAHHPDEIAATIKTAKEIFSSVAVVFQPHTYSRTKSLMNEFAIALAQADSVVVAPVFSAREQPIEGVNSHALCRKIVAIKERAYCFDSFCEIMDFARTAPEKAIVFMGAGNIDALADAFIACAEQ